MGPRAISGLSHRPPAADHLRANQEPRAARTAAMELTPAIHARCGIAPLPQLTSPPRPPINPPRGAVTPRRFNQTPFDDHSGGRPPRLTIRRRPGPLPYTSERLLGRSMRRPESGQPAERQVMTLPCNRHCFREFGMGVCSSKHWTVRHQPERAFPTTQVQGCYRNGIRCRPLL
jgi:hypothetical protein